MHLTRPKSSKGRNRPTLSHNPHTDAFQNPPVTPKPPAAEYDTSDRVLRSRSSFLWQTSRLSATDEVAELLQNVPDAPSPSLNKYKVLPSIEKKSLESASGGRIMGAKTSKLSLSDNLILQARPQVPHPSSERTQTATRSNPEMGRVAEVQCRGWSKPPDPGTIHAESPPVIPQGSLLLAVRTPCGRRFEQQFLPTDSLLTVIASAEARYGTRYEQGFVETVDVPRRTFTDLKRTLAQCSIVNRSVLCISQDSMDST